MSYRNNTQVIFDGDNDTWAYGCMKGWKENERIDFTLYYAHDIRPLTDRACEDTLKDDGVRKWQMRSKLSYSSVRPQGTFTGLSAGRSTSLHGRICPSSWPTSIENEITARIVVRQLFGAYKLFISLSKWRSSTMPSTTFPRNTHGATLLSRAPGTITTVSTKNCGCNHMGADLSVSYEHLPAPFRVADRAPLAAQKTHLWIKGFNLCLIAFAAVVTSWAVSPSDLRAVLGICGVPALLLALILTPVPLQKKPNKQRFSARTKKNISHI